MVEGREQRTEEDAEDEAAADKEEQKETEHSDLVVELKSFVWQEVAYDVAAVERRDGNEIEDEEQEVDEDDEIKEQGDGKEGGEIFCRNAGNVRGQRHRRRNGEDTAGNEMLDDEQKDEGDGSRDEIAGGAGEGDKDVVAAIVFEVAAGDWSGFGPADQRPVVEQGEQRHDDGAERVEVFERVESDAAEHAGGGIAQAPGGPGVGALVDTEGENQNNDLKDDEDDFLVHGSSSLPESGTRGASDEFACHENGAGV
jgi:hypothetical protein